MPSILPLKITAALATIVCLLVAFQHGEMDGQSAMAALGLLFNFLVGVITHNDNDKAGPNPAAQSKEVR